jgi:hypothetical protein
MWPIREIRRLPCPIPAFCAQYPQAQGVRRPRRSEPSTASSVSGPTLSLTRSRSVDQNAVLSRESMRFGRRNGGVPMLFLLLLGRSYIDRGHILAQFQQGDSDDKDLQSEAARIDCGGAPLCPGERSNGGAWSHRRRRTQYEHVPPPVASRRLRGCRGGMRAKWPSRSQRGCRRGRKWRDFRWWRSRR